LGLKIAALVAILPQIQNSGSDKLSKGFVDIKPIVNIHNNKKLGLKLPL